MIEGYLMILTPIFYVSVVVLLLISLFVYRTRIKWNGKALTAHRIFQALLVRVQDRIQPKNTVRGVYSSFEEAVAAAPATKATGYEAAKAENWYFDKLTKVQLDDYPVIYWLKNAFADSNTVFEIGGHVGVAYYGFSQVLEYPRDLSWTILDVPSVMKAGEALAREKDPTHHLHFAHDGLNAVKGADIVVSVGALQYLETNLSSILSNFQQRPKHVIINVTPVYDGPQFVTIQNLGSVYCPYRIFNRRDLVDSLESMGYRLVDSWANPRHFDVPRHPDKTFEHYSGFYFQSEDNRLQQS